MSRDEIFNALCAVYFAEEVRLEDKVAELERYINYKGADDVVMLELIRARARLDYFKTYLRDVLDFLRYYDR